MVELNVGVGKAMRVAWGFPHTRPGNAALRTSRADDRALAYVFHDSRRC
jgi:hypothetical protein